MRSVLALQRSVGNAAVARLVQSQTGPVAGGDGAGGADENAVDAGRRSLARLGQSRNAPVAGGGDGGGGTDDDEVDAGRRALLGTGGTLARQPQPPGTAPGASAKTKSGITRGDFESPPPKVNMKGGAPTAKKVGEDKVELSGPGIEGSAKVTWKAAQQPDPSAPAPPPDPTVETGFIQTVLHSDRGFLYTDDGKATGKVGREVRDIVPDGSRDARHLAGQKGNKGKPIQGSGRGPFYQEPRSVKRGESTDVTMTDEPTGGDTPFKLKGSDGKEYTLARVTGSDHFRLSVGVAETSDYGSPIHLSASEWTVPWDMEVAGGAGQGKAAHLDQYKGSLDDIKPGTGWATADAQRFPWPHDEAEAQTLSSSELIKAIPFAQSIDEPSWELMCRVLRARNPTCRIVLDIRRSPTAFNDILSIKVSGPRTATKTGKKWFSGQLPFDFQLLELMDPQDLRVGMSLQMEFTDEGGQANTTAWPFPFGAFGPILFYWNAKGTAAGEEGDKKKAKADAPTDIAVTAIGFS